MTLRLEPVLMPGEVVPSVRPGCRVAPVADVPAARTYEEAAARRARLPRGAAFLPGVVPFVSRTELEAWGLERRCHERPRTSIADVRLRHRMVVGTPEQVAEELASWYEAGVVDGYHLIPPALPEGLAPFTRLVLPLLRPATANDVGRGWSRAG